MAQNYQLSVNYFPFTSRPQTAGLESAPFVLFILWRCLGLLAVLRQELLLTPYFNLFTLSPFPCFLRRGQDKAYGTGEAVLFSSQLVNSRATLRLSPLASNNPTGSGVVVISHSGGSWKAVMYLFLLFKKKHLVSFLCVPKTS